MGGKKGGLILMERPLNLGSRTGCLLLMKRRWDLVGKRGVISPEKGEARNLLERWLASSGELGGGPLLGNKGAPQ